jgi:hypothetical protein
MDRIVRQELGDPIVVDGDLIVGVRRDASGHVTCVQITTPTRPRPRAHPMPQPRDARLASRVRQERRCATEIAPALIPSLKRRPDNALRDRRVGRRNDRVARPRPPARPRPRGSMPPAVKRRLATLAAAASLVLWLQSAVVGRTLWVSAPVNRYVLATSAAGRLSVCWSTSVLNPRTRPADYGVRMSRADRRSVAHRGRSQWWVWFGAEAGNVLYGTLDGAQVWTWGFNIPWWYVVTPTVVAAAMCWRTHLNRRRVGCCTACGYDLRATPDRCPECGAAPAAAAAR